MNSSDVATLPRARHLSIAQWFVLAVVLGILALFAVGIQMRGAQPVDKGAAPAFSIPLYSGGDFTLSEHQGHVVVVNFWASWCIPCRQEAPVLENTWRKYKDRGVVFVGVDYVDSENEARKFIQEFDVTYPNGIDIGTETSRKYHIQGVPETYFVGKDGQLHSNHIGPIDVPTLSAKIDELLKK